ncbi:MAG: hypothetical protein AABY22_30225 [Nanoarchaeota archaeon]
MTNKEISQKIAKEIISRWVLCVEFEYEEIYYPSLEYKQEQFNRITKLVEEILNKSEI